MTDKIINLLTNVIYYGLLMPVKICWKIFKFYWLCIMVVFGLGFFTRNN